MKILIIKSNTYDIFSSFIFKSIKHDGFHMNFIIIFVIKIEIIKNLELHKVLW